MMLRQAGHYYGTEKEMDSRNRALRPALKRSRCWLRLVSSHLSLNPAEISVGIKVEARSEPLQDLPLRLPITHLDTPQHTPTHLYPRQKLLLVKIANLSVKLHLYIRIVVITY